MTLSDFISTIKMKDAEGNRTYVYTEVDGVKYGQSYQNTVNTREGMIENFAVLYYPMVQEKEERLKHFYIISLITALDLFEGGIEIYRLYPDNTEALIEKVQEIYEAHERGDSLAVQRSQK